MKNVFEAKEFISSSTFLYNKKNDTKSIGTSWIADAGDFCEPEFDIRNIWKQCGIGRMTQKKSKKIIVDSLFF